MLSSLAFGTGTLSRGRNFELSSEQSYTTEFNSIRNALIMQPTTLILRHTRENLKKCSLRGLESRPDFLFYTYPQDPLPPLQEYILLTVEAPILSEADRSKGLFFIDATWHLAGKMEKFVDRTQKLEKRSLPPYFRTAYPRKQTGCTDPERGLATLEAIYIAFLLTCRPCEGLLDNYYWKEPFLKQFNSLTNKV